MTVYVKEFKSEIAFWIAGRFEYSAFCQPLDFDWPFSFFQVIKYMVWCSNLLLLNLEWNIQLFCSYMEDHMFRWLIPCPTALAFWKWKNTKSSFTQWEVQNKQLSLVGGEAWFCPSDHVQLILIVSYHCFALSNKIIDGTLCNSHAVLSFRSWWQTLIRVTAFFVFTP